MKVIKKYTAIKIDSVDQVGYLKTRNINFSYGKVGGEFYSRKHLAREFDTEEQAIEAAYKEDEYASWLILPLIRFEIEN